MKRYKSNFIRTLVERGYLHQCTEIDALDSIAAKKCLTAYIGYDCTAPSLHVGSLVQIMMQRQLQLNGHKPIVLLGGGTTKIGDPSGKDESRKLLDEAKIAANMKGIKEILNRFLKFGDGPTDAIFVDNDEWLSELKYVPFLRNIGRYFSVNRMLSFESVKTRLERHQPLTFLEFNYMILQAYDFLNLYQLYGCELQMGGSDQWGNIVNGVELGRRVEGKELFGFTTPLITTASGAKMGKTAQGAIWLNIDMLSSYDYWQFWRNTEDGDVGRFLRLFTELPIKTILDLEKLKGAEINEAKKILADEATRLCHGKGAAQEARETAKSTFENGSLGSELPTISIHKDVLKNGVDLVELMKQTNLCSSNSEARRLIKAGGARVNDKVIVSEKHTVRQNDLNSSGVIKISAGRKRHALVRPN